MKEGTLCLSGRSAKYGTAFTNLIIVSLLSPSFSHDNDCCTLSLESRTRADRRPLARPPSVPDQPNLQREVDGGGGGGGRTQRDRRRPLAHSKEVGKEGRKEGGTTIGGGDAAVERTGADGPPDDRTLGYF